MIDMKFFRYVSVAATVFFCLAAGGCKDDKTVEAEYIILSLDSYTFEPEGQEGVAVGVRANVQWRPDTRDSWIILSARDETSVTVTAAPNESKEMRSGKVTFYGGGMTRTFTVEQLPSTYSGIFRELDFLSGTAIAMSRGGRYIAGATVREADDEKYIYNLIIVETATGNRTDVGEIEGTGVRAISDDGRTVMVYSSNGSYVLRDGEKVDLGAIGGIIDIVLADMSADGSVVVGYGKAGGTNYGIKWIDGIPELLQNPETNGLGQPLKSGAMTRGCSADGSVVIGQEWDNQTACYWKDGKVAYAGEDIINVHVEDVMGRSYTLFDRPVLDVGSYISLSPNGRYLSVRFRAESYTQGDLRPSVTYYACIMDLDSGGTTLLTDYPDYAGITALDDGTASIATPSYGCTDGYIYVPDSREAVPTPDWFYRQYGLSMPKNRILWRVSTDGNVLFGVRDLKSTLGMLALRFWYCIPSGAGQTN